MASRIDIGHRIARARKELGMKQADVSKISNINTVVISKIENGKFTGSFDIIERCIDAVGLEFLVAPKTRRIPSMNDISELFGDDD